MGELGTLRRMKGALPLLGMLLAAVALPAGAGTLYKCVGADGVPAYVGKRVAGARCSVVSRYTPVPAAVPSPATGSVTTTPEVASASSKAKAGAGKSAAKPIAPRFVGMGVSTTYSYIDANGVRNYSNRRPAGVRGVQVSKVEYPIFRMDTCYACAVNPGVNFASTRLNTAAYQGEIAAAARDFGVEEAIIRAIIHAESAFRPTALSRVGAQGLMQLMPATARRFGVSDAFNAGQNIRGGVQYLGWLLKRYNGDLTKAAAGYNAGEGAVDRHGGVPPYRETRRYVQRVGVLAERYRGMLAAK